MTPREKTGEVLALISLLQAPAVVGASSGVTPVVLRPEPSGDDASEAAEEAAEPEPPGASRPAATAPALVQFVAGLNASLDSVRRGALRGAFWPVLSAAEGPDSVPRTLGARLARWSPLLAAAGIPALTLTVELVQAALVPSDPGDGASPPAESEAAPPAERTGSDPPGGRGTRCPWRASNFLPSLRPSSAWRPWRRSISRKSGPVRDTRGSDCGRGACPAAAVTSSDRNRGARRARRHPRPLTIERPRQGR